MEKLRMACELSCSMRCSLLFMSGRKDRTISTIVPQKQLRD